MKAFADAVRPRVPRLGFGVLDVVERQIKLVIMRLRLAAILRSVVGQDASEAHVVLGKERRHPVVEQVSRRDRRLGRVELGRRHLALRIDKGLLVDTTNALDGADVERVPRTKIARMGRFDITARDIIFSLLFQSGNLRVAQNDTVLGRPLFQGRQTKLK